MKRCISCQKDIPDTAIHCVFCGAKQGQAQTPAAAQKTIMGYAVDLQKYMGGQGGTPGTPAGAPPPGDAAQKTMMAGVGGAPMPPMAGPPPGADQRWVHRRRWGWARRSHRGALGQAKATAKAKG